MHSSSLATVPQCTMDPPSSRPVQGMPPQMGQPVVAGTVMPGDVGEVWDGQTTPDPSMPMKDGQPDSQATSDPSDATPTPREAARRLVRFTEEVQLKQRSPLIATPPRQKAVTKRPLPIRSRQIAD
jgi:hypothetical protein